MSESINADADELAHDEQLDVLDPLRHLMHQSSCSSSSSSFEDLDINPPPGFLPNQPHSIHNKTLQLSFPSHPHPISISLAIDASPGCGGIAWPAGQVLANYLVKRGPSLLAHKTVLELGSGTGLVGLVAAKLGAKRVCITDQLPLLDIMRTNVLANALQTSIDVAELNWGAPIPIDSSIPCTPDIILAADCVYFEPAFPLLVQTLAELVGDTTEVLFCYKKRRKADKRFFTLLKKRFTWSEVTDDPDREVYAREAISLLRLFKRNLGVEEAGRKRI